MKNKKAFYKTLEVMIAVILTFLFVRYFIPQFTPTEIPNKPDLNILPRLVDNTNFRNCVLAGDETCIESEIDSVIPRGYGFDTSISNDINYEKAGLPATKDIYIESDFISANLTVYNPVIVKIYYWRK